MKCFKCGCEILTGEIVSNRGRSHYICPSEAERSGAAKPGLPSANCSARPSAVAPKDSLISSVVPREKAEPPGIDDLAACPFCGVKPSVFVDDLDNPTDFTITCANKDGCLVEIEISGGDFTDLANIWNCRAGDQAREPGGAAPCGQRAVARNDKLKDAGKEASE